MNRALFATIIGGVGVLGLSMAMMGCATDVEDPVPPSPAPEAQRDPPKQQLNAQLRDPEAQLISAIAINHGLENVPAKQPTPTPRPFKEPAEAP